MKAIRILFVVALMACAATIARADGVDPKVLIGGGGSCDSKTLTGLTETFTVQTGCPVDFINNIVADDEEVTLQMIVVNIVTDFSDIGPLGCGFDTTEGVKPSPFNSAVVSSPKSCTFSNTSDDELTLGVPFGDKFSLNFDANFGKNVTFTIAQNVIPTPEPGTMLLLAAGLGGLCAFRKRLY